MPKKLVALSLFAGGGGLDLGFAAAGYDICFSTDKDPFSCKTLVANARKKPFVKRHPVLEADICKLSTKEILRIAKKSASEIDLIMGGPPCQAFSIFGKRGGIKDPRGKLVWEFLRIVKEISPKAFVFENVSGLKTIHEGKLFAELLDALQLGGKYSVSTHTYQVADYGVPQFRNRIIFIGSREKIDVPQMEVTHGDSLFASKPFVTVRTVLHNMPEPATGLANHIGRQHSAQIVERYAKLVHGERDPKTRINKLHPERPSYTIVVGSDAGGGKGHVHPFVPREVTPRESARIQTFPDWWTFSGTGRHVIRQVGNAVPPVFAALLGEHIKRFVFKQKKISSYESLIDRLDLPFLKNCK